MTHWQARMRGRLGGGGRLQVSAIVGHAPSAKFNVQWPVVEYQAKQSRRGRRRWRRRLRDLRAAGVSESPTSGSIAARAQVAEAHCPLQVRGPLVGGRL